MSSWLYLEADLICLCILGVVRISIAQRTVKMPDDRFFLGVVDGVLVMLVSDAAWAAIDGKIFFAARFLNVFASGLYLFFTAAISLLWLIYIHYRLYEDVPGLKKLLPYFGLPAAILLILCIASYWTGWVYSVDANNVYHRGPLHWLQMVIGSAYLFAAALYTIRGAVQGNLRISRQECRLIVAMTLFAACSGLAQKVLFKVPVALAGVVIALLSVFINIQNKRVSQDELTQISDRGRMRRYITGRVSSRLRREPLYLLLLDMDDFTDFNGQFGRLAGNEM
ncbi:MAG: diguanylate cyclase, partial [Eubacteriales bacterium]|nr:diguanylate cyclase [Eubacteriales bacterium]